MKKIILLAILLIFLCGCGSNNSKSDQVINKKGIDFLSDGKLMDSKYSFDSKKSAVVKGMGKEKEKTGVGGLEVYIYDDITYFYPYEGNDTSQVWGMQSTKPGFKICPDLELGMKTEKYRKILGKPTEEGKNAEGEESINVNNEVLEYYLKYKLNDDKYSLTFYSKDKDSEVKYVHFFNNSKITNQ